jgi:hypothetical protein
MDFINCNLSSADVDTIIFALSVIPKLHLEYTPEQALLNQASCTSAAKKLPLRNIPFSDDELRVISSAVQAVDMINRGLLAVEPSLKKECSSYLFTINHLCSLFDIE